MVMAAVLSVLLFAVPANGMQSSVRVKRAEQLDTPGGATEAAFAAFRAAHGRWLTLEPREHERRFSIFQRRVAEVEQHNSRQGQRWRKGVNAFSAHTDEELKQLCGYKSVAQKGGAAQPKHASLISGSKSTDNEFESLPEEKLWRNLYNTEFIRDQGQCGSCWAVAASTVLGAHSEIYAKNNSFSTQEIVDCVPNPHKCGGTGGCDGATVELAMQYTMLKGLQSPQGYGAYVARDGSCPFQASERSHPSMQQLTSFSTDAGVYSAQENAPSRDFGMTGWERLPTNEYQPLLQALYNRGPVAISVAASDLFMYEDGIFDGCNDFVVNHAVTLVGYGKQGGDKFYLIQNSWGASWGEGGRFRVLRRDNEAAHCGNDTKPLEGVACEGETQAVVVCGTCGVLYDSVVPHFDKSL